jgi:hypothetical protein
MSAKKHDVASDLTAERLRALVEYDSATGVFTWIGRPRVCHGKEAGSQRRDGRWHIRVDGFLYLRSRLAWLYMTGAWPLEEVDHKDCCSSNDAWDNLRDVTRSINSQNKRRANSRSSTGFLGVSVNGKRFQAALKVGDNRHRFGTYDKPEQAHEAYVSGKRLLHPGGNL